ncbi:GTPase-activating Rap/Ran-GAP domain-like protein 3 [Balamuthia mandrillaris]
MNPTTPRSWSPSRGFIGEGEAGGEAPVSIHSRKNKPPAPPRQRAGSLSRSTSSQPVPLDAPTSSVSEHAKVASTDGENSSHHKGKKRRPRSTELLKSLMPRMGGPEQSAPVPVASPTTSSSTALPRSYSATVSAASPPRAATTGMPPGKLRIEGGKIQLQRTLEEQLAFLTEQVERLQMEVQEKSQERAALVHQNELLKQEVMELRRANRKSFSEGFSSSGRAIPLPSFLSEALKADSNDLEEETSEKPPPKTKGQSRRGIQWKLRRATVDLSSPNAIAMIREQQALENGGEEEEEIEAEADAEDNRRMKRLLLLSQIGKSTLRHFKQKDSNDATDSADSGAVSSDAQQQKNTKRGNSVKDLVSLYQKERQQLPGADASLATEGSSLMLLKTERSRSREGRPYMVAAPTSPSPRGTIIVSPANARKHLTRSLIQVEEGWIREHEHEFCLDAAQYSKLESHAWYKDFFFGKAHRNFLGIETPLGTIIISFKREEANDVYRVLIKTQDGDQNIFIPAASVDISGWCSSPYKLLQMVNPLLLSCGIVREVTTPQLSQYLLDMERKEKPQQYKFGVLLVKEGQTLEEDMFSNRQGSPHWEEFLRFLGEEVKLEGWKKFAGGLDVRRNTTGNSSIYNSWQGNEVMFHVSTMLPFDPTPNSQQLERKRHLGNDINLIVFVDEEKGSTTDRSWQFRTSTVASHFIHNIFVIRRFKMIAESQDDKMGVGGGEAGAPSTNHMEAYYQLTVCSKEDVPPFGPTLPKPCVFSTKDPLFKDFLMAKLINGELATYRTISFCKKLRRGRRAMLDEAVSQFFFDKASDK